MTGGFGIHLGGTATDRAGGLLRLRAVADALVGEDWSLETDEIVGRFVLLVVGDDGRVIERLIDVPVARSAAIRRDQEAQLERDRVELEPLLRADVELRSLPESEKRLLDGNR